MSAPTALSATEVDGMLAGGRARVVDVRSAGEFAAVRIPGSVNVPLDLLRAHRTGLAVEHGDPVVLACASGTRAEQAHGLLADHGFASLSVLHGGVDAWEADGRPVDRSGGAWAMERQVRLTAGSLVFGGVLASTRYRPAVALAGAIGAGLCFSAITNTCGMARVLALLPHNRAGEPDPATAVASLAR